MATSESDDFESADEEWNIRRNRQFQSKSPKTINSESDDDVENFSSSDHEIDKEPVPSQDEIKDESDPVIKNAITEQPKKADNLSAITSAPSLKEELEPSKPRRVVQRAKKNGPKGFKLGAKKVEHLEESEMPEELRSNLKFKDVFKTEGWEGLEDDKVFAEEESRNKSSKSSISPSSDKVSPDSDSQDGSSVSGWGGWGGWGVSSLINTATSGVSTLTSTMSQGLSLLEETIGTTDPVELARRDAITSAGHQSETKEKEEPSEVYQESFPTSYMFSNIISGVTSITKLVESTSSKVISGGLDTLEVIGKKTMEVLQEGDPGLKKKRAFFLSETDKPILSHILREAKEKADTEEKTLEEREMSRKVHFESLFDDYQGLVHLEALEMLSKQSNMKIEHRLVDLSDEELDSLQETLEEIKQLCDLGDEDDEEESGKDLKERLDEACKSLGVAINCDKLTNALQEIRKNLSPDEQSPTHRQIFQQAISALAQFTALSVERFHKSAELLLVKERRSTVNEADALVQLTRILCEQISAIANLFGDRLNEFKDDAIKDEVNSSITTIFLEAANASSYIQDAFRLLVPVLQVGAL